MGWILLLRRSIDIGAPQPVNFSSDAIKRKRSTMGLYFENHLSTMRRQDKDRDFSILFDGIC